jgi:PilZ domain
MDHLSHCGEKQKSRAQRFEISMPLRYREAGEENWHEGCVRNISRTGVLFAARSPVQEDAEVELILELPAASSVLAGGRVCCMGRVVRTVLPAAADAPPALAARIQSYEFMPADPV